jgi:hypothetical protein
MPGTPASDTSWIVELYRLRSTEPFRYPIRKSWLFNDNNKRFALLDSHKVPAFLSDTEPERDRIATVPSKCSDQGRDN